MDDKPLGSSLREKLPRSVLLWYINWSSKECQQMLLWCQERWRRRSVLRRHGPWRHRGGGARTPLCWQSPWRRSSVLRCQGSWRSSYRGASALGAAVLRRHGDRQHRGAPGPLPPLRSQGPWRHKTNLRHQSSWHRSVGPPFAMLVVRGTGRHAGRLCGATNDGAAKLCCGAMARAAAKRARF